MMTFFSSLGSLGMSIVRSSPASAFSRAFEALDLALAILLSSGSVDGSTRRTRDSSRSLRTRFHSSNFR